MSLFVVHHQDIERHQINSVVCHSARHAAGVGHRVASEAQGHARAAARSGREVHFAAMLLDDLLDDREAQAGALFAGRDVRFQIAHAALRQANSVVADAHGQDASSFASTVTAYPPAVVGLRRRGAWPRWPRPRS